MVMASSPKNSDVRSMTLADPKLHRALRRMIATKMAAADAEDVLQATLTDAIAAVEAPQSAHEIRKWVFGIARHKIADHHRKASRYDLSEPLPESEATSAPHSAEDLARWVEGELPEGKETEKTLEWMAREADGEKLEAIASEENIPAPRVRQRVARLRRFFRERWAAQLAVLGIFAAVVAAGIAWWRHSVLKPDLVPERAERAPRKLDEAMTLRERALERCRERAFEDCIRGLDEARTLDPIGDEAEVIQDARAAAREALSPEPPDPEPTAVPTSSAAPAPSGSAPPRRPAPGPHRSSLTSEPPVPKPPSMGSSGEK
jgi:DNA-directed RNA polymerase specialized sigma24 family protein